MKRNLLFCTLAFLSFSCLAAQQARPITDIIADTVTNYLSPFGGKGQPGEKLLVLHFKAPSAALNDWAIDRFTEIFKQHGTVPLERRNRPDFFDAAGLKNDIELDDDAAAALGNRAGVRTVFTGAFSPNGGNWALDIRAVSAADKKVVWSKNYLVKPGDTFIRLAAQVPPAAPDPVTAIPNTAPETLPLPDPIAASEPVSAIPVPGPVETDTVTGIPAKTKDDLLTEAAQTAAVREYHEFVDKNFPNITIDDPRISNIGGSKPFLVSYTWRHTDKIPVVRTMADFFQALADANQGDFYETAFKYYQTSYVNTALEISFKGFAAPRRLIKMEYQWDLEFTLFDTEGNSIDVRRATLRRKIPFGKGSDGGTLNFYLTTEARSMMDTLRLTKITMR